MYVEGPGLLEHHPIWDLEVILLSKGFLGGTVVKNPTANARDARDKNVGNVHVRSLCQEDPVEYEIATHSSILAWKIP